MPFLGKARSSSTPNPSRAMQTLWRGDVYLPSWHPGRLSGAGLSASSDAAYPARICGSPECSVIWRAPWRSRQRPIFEERWGCSGRCMFAMVQTALFRESADAVKLISTTPHRHRVPLGLLMLAQGWITHPQLRSALEAQRASGTGKIGQWLVDTCGVDQDQITRALGMQWGCPVLTTDGFSPDAMALVLPRLLIEKFGPVPIRVAGAKILYLGFSDRLDATVALAMEKMTELKVESGVVSGSQLDLAHKQLLACHEVEVKLERAEDMDSLAARITALIEQKQPHKSRVVRMHNYYWLRLWLEKGALGRSGSIPRTREDVKDYLFTAS